MSGAQAVRHGPGAAAGLTLSQRETRAAWTMMSPAILLAVTFLVVPFALAIGLSFTNQRLVPNPNAPTDIVWFTNYLRILGDGDFLQSFWNTLVFAAVIVPLQSAFALAVALLLNSALPLRNLFRGIYFLPTVLSMVVVSVVWFSLYQHDGFFNTALGAVTFGAVEPVDWLRDPDLALPAIILLSMWQGFGFQMVIYLAGLQQINAALYEAARVDGATRWQEFRHITLPCLRNTHIVVMVTTTILAFKLFSQVELLTQGGPRGATNTVVRYIYQSGFSEGRVGRAAAASVVFFVAVLLIALVQRWLVREEREIR
ncbi:MAG: sugar ABC transporter permease [Alphaproteobacteria bacterium]